MSTEQDPAFIYRMGMCDAMAVALHRLTGCDLGIFRGYFPDPDGDEGDELWDDYHAVIVINEEVPVWLDVDGLHEGMIRAPIEFTEQKQVRVQLDAADESEVAETFSTAGVSEDQIEQAMDFIRADPKLTRLVEHYAATFLIHPHGQEP